MPRSTTAHRVAAESRGKPDLTRRLTPVYGNNGWGCIGCFQEQRPTDDALHGEAEQWEEV